MNQKIVLMGKINSLNDQKDSSNEQKIVQMGQKIVKMSK